MLVAKLPAMHRVRLLGINRTPSIAAEGGEGLLADALLSDVHARRPSGTMLPLASQLKGRRGRGRGRARPTTGAMLRKDGGLTS